MPFHLCIILLCYPYKHCFRFMKPKKKLYVRAKNKTALICIWGASMIDPHDPTLKERLRRRNPSGHFEISEIELVLSIRDLRAKAIMSQLACCALYFWNEAPQNFNVIPGDCVTDQICGKRLSRIWVSIFCARQ